MLRLDSCSRVAKLHILVSVLVLLGHTNAGAAAVAQGEGVDTGKKLGKTQILDVFDFLRARLESNYAKIQTWQGVYALTDKFYRNSQPADTVPSRVTSIDRLADGRPYWEIKNVRVSFALDAMHDMLRSDYTPSESPQFVDVASGRPHAFDAKSYTYEHILTSEHWVSFPLNERIGQIEGFPPLEHVERNSGGRVVQRDEPNHAFSEKFLGTLVDARELFGNGTHRFSELCKLYAASVRGESTDGERKHAEENVEMYMVEGDDGGTLYRLRIYYRSGPKHDVAYYIDTVFDSSVDFNVTSDIRMTPGVSLKGLREWSYVKQDGIVLPSHYTFAHYDSKERVAGAPFAVRSFALDSSILNEPIPASLFELESLQFEHGDRLHDRIKNELLVFDEDAGKFIPSDQFVPKVATIHESEGLERKSSNFKVFVVLNGAFFVIVGVLLFIRRVQVRRG